MTLKNVARRLASLYSRRSLQGYVHWKVTSDPLYPAVFDELRNDDRPLTDVGCGVGLLEFFLREQGYNVPILGLDFDPRKIEVAREVALRYHDVEFRIADAREALPSGHNVALLDILQYFDKDSQQRILENAARAVPPGGLVILRQAVRDQSWRFWLTDHVDAFARVIRWMRAEQLEFPTRQEIIAPFAGFSVEVRPLWGRMPFNNYLFVFRRHAADHPPE